MKDTKVLVSEFKEKTENMLDSIKHEDYDRLNVLIKERQKILDIFEENSGDYHKDEIKEQFKSENILELDKEVNDLTKKNFLIVKAKLKSMNSNMTVKNKYNPGFSGKSFFFNKKVY